MNTLKTGVVDLTDKRQIYDVYNGLIGLYKDKETEIKNEVEKGGVKKTTIEHGDYGYFPYDGNKIIRFFARTNMGKVEAFCTKHFDKCGMRADVNKNPDQYFICGNLFN